MENIFTNKNSDIVGSYSEGSHKIINCECEFNISEKCNGVYQRAYRDFLQTYKANNNRYICFFCSRASKYQGVKNPNKKYNYEKLNFLKFDTNPIIAYFLGWIASDGSINENTGSISIKIKIDDEEILHHFIEEFELSCDTKKDKLHHFSSLNIYDQDIAKNIRDILGLPNSLVSAKKSNIIKYPYFTNSMCEKRFLQGFFEGDGHIRNIEKRKYLDCCITSNSMDFLSSIQEKIPFKSKIYNNSLTWGSTNALSFLNFIYDQKTFALSRKYDMYIRWKTQITNQ